MKKQMEPQLMRVEKIVREFTVGKKVIRALKGIDLVIPPGTLTIFQGPSGSGKTTMMNILGAMDRPTSGSVYFEEDEIIGWNDTRRDHLRRDQIGFIFQSIALIPVMTAYENVDFALRIARIPAEERHQRVCESLDRVGLKKRMHHMPQEMSGGEQQRVAIARAITHGPRVILADEPTSDLDSKTGLMVINLFKELITEKKISIIMTSHNPGIVEMGDVVYTFRDGESEREK